MSTILIFAGGDLAPQMILDDIPRGDYVIAADSGYNSAVSLGFHVDAVIGDFDSLSPALPLRPETEEIRFPVDKDATDLELAFELAIGRDPARIVLVGGEGGRLDHELSALTVVASPRWAAVPTIEWARTDARIHVIRGATRVQGDPGSVISLLAFNGDAGGVATQGLQWELDDETIYGGSSRGVSNLFQSPETLIRVESGTLVAIIPYGE